MNKDILTYLLILTYKHSKTDLYFTDKYNPSLQRQIEFHRRTVPYVSAQKFKMNVKIAISALCVMKSVTNYSTDKYIQCAIWFSLEIQNDLIHSVAEEAVSTSIAGGCQGRYFSIMCYEVGQSLA